MQAIHDHEKNDRGALLERLRACKRRQDYAGAIETCKALIWPCRDWRTGYELGRHWLWSAQGESIHCDCGLCAVCNGAGPIAPNPTRAAWAASMLAELSIYAGRCFRCDSDHRDGHCWGTLPCEAGMGEPVPNVLPHYVEAIRIWSPDNWWDRLRQWSRGQFLSQHAGWFVYPVDVLRYGAPGDPNAISIRRDDGTVTCGETCPRLPAIDMESKTWTK